MSRGTTNASPRAPAKPDLVLNVAVAGSRTIPPEILSAVTATLRDVLTALDDTIAAIKPGTSERYELAANYSTKRPTLRLVSGLADGADLLAADLHRSLKPEHVTHELAAVLPFDRKTFRNLSPVENKTLFDELIGKCVWVHELDGRYAADPTDPAAADEARLFAKRSRARAYRAQSEILLRQCDVVIAISDPGEPGRAGGTRETLAAALALRLPIVHISLRDARVRLVETRAQMNDLPFGPPHCGWRKALDETIAEILAAPYRVRMDKPFEPGALTPEERELFRIFFASSIPDGSFFHRLWHGALRWIWRVVERSLRNPDGPSKSIREPEIAPLRDYRKRASELNAHYAGMYRGAFVLNYSLAVVAVFLAAVGLFATLWPEEPPEWPLVVLGVLKLAIVAAIFATTADANEGRWSELAVGYRYISERLRAMNYLPQLGVLRVPTPSATQATTRRLQQTIADWLTLAIVRHAHFLNVPSKTVAIDTAAGLQAVHDTWLTGQIEYHRSSADRMKRMSGRLEGLAEWATVLVIAFVAVDLILVAGIALHLFDKEHSKFAHDLSPFYVFIAIVLPAAIAGANGIRFQSESDRLAERSAVFSHILKDVLTEVAKLHAEMVAAKGTSGDPGAWAGPAALLAESCAQLFLDEVAEWSVLYAKELGDA